MPKIKFNQILFFLIFTSFIALFFAYFSEYYMGLKPCKLCLYQRLPFFAIIFISLAAIFFNAKKYISLIVISLLLLNAGIAIYHVGVENKIFKISQGCVSALDDSSLEALKQSLLENSLMRCDEPQFFFLGLSMAALNALYSMIIAIMAAFFIRRSS